jgi:ankyrin repeat protein
MRKYEPEEASISGIARLLLERGADVNALSKIQSTPLHVASYNGKLELARLLLDHGAQVDTANE